MNIETYEVEELKSSEATTMAADSEAIELIEQMGLKGQQILCNKDTATRLPYRKMTALEHLVFSTFCPQQTPLEDYASGIIPLRVLQVAAHCKQTGFFKHLEVWHPADVKVDPVLVGIWEERPYVRHPFLLARWGEVMPTFEELVKKSKAIWITKAKAKIRSIIVEAKADEERTEAVADAVFSGQSSATPPNYHGY